MRKHLNTLFVTLEGAYLRKDGEAIVVKHGGEIKLRVPLHNLEGIVTFGWDTTATATLLHACAGAGIAISFLSPHGKFLASSHGPQSGNILLRREQYRRADLPEASAAIARNLVAAKLANSRAVLRRAVRDNTESDSPRNAALLDAADFHSSRIGLLSRAENLDEIRGVEGDSAATYFAVFPRLITATDPALKMQGRSRRPPLDPVNALLSFLYTLLAHDCRSACEAVGLDPQCGFLHRDRPGRHSLALDLMEEFRPVLADRAVLTLLNRGQIGAGDFDLKESGAVLLKPDSRKTVLTHWQERKAEEIQHPFLGEKTTIGLLPHLQARLLARHLRGDIDAYPAMIWK